MKKAAVCLVAVAALTALPCRADEDTILKTKVGPVDVGLFIPSDTKPLRGLYVHAAHYRIKSTDRWAEASRAIGFGHIALNINLKLNNRPKKLRTGLDEALIEFAAKTGRSELPHLPMIGIGHSAGGMVVPVLLTTPERAITTCVSCGWITDPKKLKPADKSMPMLFTLGAIPDAFKMLPGIESRFLPARKEELAWGLGLQWGCAHDFANSAALFIPWCEAVSAMRLPKYPPRTGGPVKLRDIKLSDSWLGQSPTIETNLATVAPYKDYKGDKTKAVWLPSRSVAFVWRAIQSKDPPVVLEASAKDGSAELPKANPKSERQMTVASGGSIVLRATVRKGADVSKIQYYDGDRLIGESTKAPWRFDWTQAPAGLRPVWAMWTSSDGKKGVSNPALIIVRPTALKEKKK